jgi:hypothetical protein
VSNDPLGMYARTQTGTPHLLQYLWDKYVEHLAEEIEKLRAEGKNVLHVDAAKHAAPASGFVKWASQFLLENGVAETTVVESGVGLRLANNDVVTVSPAGEDVRGSMQDASAIAVTDGRQRANQSGVSHPGDIVRI